MKKSGFLQKLGVGMMAFLMIFGPVNSVMAAQEITEGELFTNGQIGVYFYDRNGGARNYCNYNGGCFIPVGDGIDYEQRFWIGLRQKGFTPEQTAGMMSNFKHEGATPVRQEGSYITARNSNPECKTREGQSYDIYLDNTNGNAHHDDCMAAISGNNYSSGGPVAGIGLGFAQWTNHNSRMGWINRLESAGLIHYLDNGVASGPNAAYNLYGAIGEDDVLREKIIEETGSDDDWKALWCLGYEYIYQEMRAKLPSMFNLSTPEEIAGEISAGYERCTNCFAGQSGYNSRVAAATSYYQKYLDGYYDNVEQMASSPSANMNDDSDSDADADADSDNDDENGGSSNQSGASSIQMSGDCSVPYNIKTPQDAWKLANQYIMDTNAMYSYSYLAPEEISDFPHTWDTPARHDYPVNPVNQQIKADWISKGYLTPDDMTTICWGADDCGQCTALSGWFVTMMTSYLYGSGSGGAVVGNLAAKNPDLAVSDTPAAMSVFSAGGHTGLVIGDFGDGTYLYLENNMNPGARLQVNRRRRGSSETYALVGDKLRIRIGNR